MSIIIPANSAVGGGYAVDNSCRFNNASDDSLTRSLGASETSLKKGTLSFWIKRAEAVGTAMWIYSNEVDNDNNRAYIEIDANANLRVLNSQGGANPVYFITDAEYRDFGAWSHFVIAIDTTQGTESNRVKIYNNGVQITSFSQATYPSVNTDLKLFEGGQTNKNHIGNIHGQSGKLSAYLSEFVYIDGTQNAATDFGEFDSDSGIWKPIDVSGLTFGNNGVYLDFEDSSALGADVSGNSNNFTVNNLTSIDQTTDTPTNNFATLNPLYKQDGVFSEGNLAYTISASDFDSGVSTIAPSLGKWYFETKITATAGGTTRNSFGICDVRDGNLVAESEFGQPGSGRVGDTVGWTGNSSTAIYKNGSSVYSGTQYTTNDILSCAVDLDNGAVYFRKNGGSWLNSGNPESGSSRTGAVTITTGQEYAFGNTAYSGSAFIINFGNPAFTGTDQADGNDRGSFEYAVPSGYLALCSLNLSEVLS